MSHVFPKATMACPLARLASECAVRLVWPWEAVQYMYIGLGQSINCQVYVSINSTIVAIVGNATMFVVYIGIHVPPTREIQLGDFTAFPKAMYIHVYVRVHVCVHVYYMLCMCMMPARRGFGTRAPTLTHHPPTIGTTLQCDLCPCSQKPFTLNACVHSSPLRTWLFNVLCFHIPPPLAI